MPAVTVDVVVIGMGPGGEDAATRLARAGLAVVGVEARLLGGECPYYACVPTKMMLRAADALAEARRVDELAGSAQVRPDWAPVAARIRAEATDDWDDAVAVERFEKAGGRFVRGRARITAPGEVTVSTADGTRVVRATRGIVLNPGTEPTAPPIEGLAGTPYWTNREAVAVEQLPDALIVLGGGPVGCEFAQVFARFGTAVTVVEAMERLLPADEPEASELLAGVFAAEGIAVRAGVSAGRVEHAAGQFRMHLDDGDVLAARRLLVATGRGTDLAALGVGAVGLDEQARTIPVDERMRAAERVWAVGDVTGQGAFTHVSMYQARIAAADILNPHSDDEEGGGESADYRAVPRVTFTDPEVGSVGLTEAAARDGGLRVRTGLARVPSSARGWIHKAGNDGLIKLVEDADRGVLVGATSAGPVGGEVLGALAVAVHAEVPTVRLQQMIYAYPTFHRAIEDALGDLAG
ncbi:dihydrolipoyl dehydrogenase family protein [Pseudonocardia asaccharolytica]|uniref:Pyridine nucleotide-disulfide oxidoreductase n=1 Tax=Pseudonocardia asaccharolytica DSM 44247 = NBRC 16224 TaxID=1123024 RepID=A0A511D7P9_9PSEU|nr:NAD(P)/FAD-dependent oxidoreductase [Pseudonocardia asaccharolytica]GEL20831.1 pyridine nucleotide-disulfide oxidoreductase [Pseudonocardia asaccharolytica DSM 44247 = NBRC 16224]